MNEKEKFIADLYPAAVKVSQETGMSWQTILAQAAQETGWGQHQLPGTCNIFNIKADNGWHGPSKTFNVWEIENGQKVWKDQSFRVYGTYEEALRDRVEFLRDNPRYTKAGLFDEGTKGNLEKEAATLQRAGYATDPLYAQSLVRVFNSATMQRAIMEAQTAELTAYHRTSGIAPSTEPHSHRLALLKQGAHGHAVEAMQADLAKLGYTDGRGHQLNADGDFGANTRDAVERFQHDHHLTTDGVVGSRTQHALHEALATHSHGPNREAQHPADTDRMQHKFQHPSHPQHALYSSLKQRLPEGTSDARLAQVTAACHCAHMHKPEDVGGIHINSTHALFLAQTFAGDFAKVDLTQPVPSVQQSQQRVELYNQQQQQTHSVQQAQAFTH